jgi:kinesin family protein 1
MILTDANKNTWERRWFSLRRSVTAAQNPSTLLNDQTINRPHLYIYSHSNELDEIGVINLNDRRVTVEHAPEMDILFDVSRLGSYPRAISLILGNF